MKILKYLINNKEKKFITIRDTGDNLIALNINAIKYLETHTTKGGKVLTEIKGKFDDIIVLRKNGKKISRKNIQFSTNKEIGFAHNIHKLLIGGTLKFV